jgi:hypothetical protein
MRRLLYLPFGIAGSILARILGRKIFRTIWAKVDEEQPPAAGDGRGSMGKVVGGRALQAAVMAGAATAVDRLLGLGRLLGPDPQHVVKALGEQPIDRGSRAGHHRRLQRPATDDLQHPAPPVAGGRRRFLVDLPPHGAEDLAAEDAGEDRADDGEREVEEASHRRQPTDSAPIGPSDWPIRMGQLEVVGDRPSCVNDRG